MSCIYQYICCGQLWVWHMICGQTCDGTPSDKLVGCNPEIDHIHLSSEAQCVSHHLPQVDCHNIKAKRSVAMMIFRKLVLVVALGFSVNQCQGSKIRVKSVWMCYFSKSAYKQGWSIEKMRVTGPPCYLLCMHEQTWSEIESILRLK